MKILFVCTGNTCRSPMAQQMLSAELCAQKIDTVIIDSAGVSSRGGKDMTEFSAAAMTKLGYTPMPHCSKSVSAELMQSADYVIAMEPLHVDILSANYPQFAKKCKTVSEISGQGDVSDPYGNPIESYYACAEQLKKSMPNLVEFIRENLQ